MTSPSRTGIERSDAAAVSERRRGNALRIQFNALEFSGRVGLASVLAGLTPIRLIRFVQAAPSDGCDLVGRGLGQDVQEDQLGTADHRRFPQ